VLGAVVALGYYLVSNLLINLEERRIRTGFGFLEQQAGFAIGESMISFAPTDSYGRAFIAGLLNTLRVSMIGIVLATLLGVIMGIARLSTNWLVAKIASVYVEVTRNIPLLLQLFFWYTVITQLLPAVREALEPFPGSC
jgi:general L-amino acid transport system permease protein